MKARIIIIAMLVCFPLSWAAAQDKKTEDRTFVSSNFFDNTFYKLMGGSSIHKVLTEESSYFTYTPSVDFSIQGGKQFSRSSSVYLLTEIQRYYRTSGLRPRILFGELDVIYSLDLTNLAFGYNPHRFFGFSLYAGGGADVIRSFGAWNLGGNLRGGATFKFRINDNLSIVADPYCKYMTGQLAKEFVYDTKVFEHGALLGLQYYVYDSQRRKHKRADSGTDAVARETWDQTLERPTGSAADGSYFTVTGGTAYRMGTKKRYTMSYDFGFTVGHRLDKLNSLNLGLLYEGYKKTPYEEGEEIINPNVNQFELDFTHNVNLTNAFYGKEMNNTVTFSSIEGLGLDLLSDSHICFGMNFHAGVEMDVKLNENFAIIVAPVFKLWLGEVNFRDAGFDLACGGYVSAGMKYSIANTKTSAARAREASYVDDGRGFDATKYSLQKRYNPNETPKERVFTMDGWTIQLLGGFGILNPGYADYNLDGHGFLAMERRFGNFQWIQFGYGMGLTTRRADGLQHMINELDVNYRFSITNFINGIDNKKFLNVSVLAGTGLDFANLETQGTKVGTHLLLGLDFGFRINDTVSLLLDPYLRLMTDNIDHMTNWRCYDSYYGLNIGVRVDLDSKR